MSLSPELALDFIVTHVAPKPFNVERIEFILHDVYFQEDYYERVAAVLKLKFGTKRPEWKAMDSSIGDDDIPF